MNDGLQCNACRHIHHEKTDKPQGDLTKNHHKALPQHQVSTPIPLLSPDFIIPFQWKNSPQKESQITYPQPLLVSGRIVKTPPFSRLLYAGTAGQKIPKT